MVNNPVLTQRRTKTYIRLVQRLTVSAKTTLPPSHTRACIHTAQHGHGLTSRRALALCRRDRKGRSHTCATGVRRLRWRGPGRRRLLQHGLRGRVGTATVADSMGGVGVSARVGGRGGTIACGTGGKR